jgi:8-oxo-dGTP diphosphatase
VLLIQRGREPALGDWSLPGGLVEVGETIESAVCREVLEETGLTVRACSLFMVLDRIIPDEQQNVEYHYVLLDFLCRYIEGEPAPGSDVTACRFVSLDSLSSYHLTEGTERVILEAFAIKDISVPALYDPSL